MKSYRLEVWVTAICLLILFVLGGGFSAFVVLNWEFFFEVVEAPQGFTGDTFFVVREYILGFPLPYLLMILLSWLGATLIAVIWAWSMDKQEEEH